MGDVFLGLIDPVGFGSQGFSSFGEISRCVYMTQIPTKIKNHLISTDQYIYISRDQKKTVGWVI